MSLVQTLRALTLGLFPGTSSNSDDLQTLNSSRLAKYNVNWISYYGVDLKRMRSEDGTSQGPVNFLRRNIDKINYFAFGKGYKLTHPRYQAQINLSELAWGKRKIEKLTAFAQAGSVTGDAFLLVAARSYSKYSATTDATAEAATQTPTAQIAVVALPSEYVTPYYDAFDQTVLVRVEIRVPFHERLADGSLTKRIQYTEITDAEVKSGILDGLNNQIVGSMQGVTDGALATTPNPIGEVYAVHVRNFPAGNSIYGMDDVTDAAPLNVAYNESSHSIGAIIDYHAAPITCVYGAKAGNLQRGPNKVWSNLPIGAKVENLSLSTDLKAANEHLARVKESLHEIMGVPEIAHGSQQAISNTSGVALHTMYLPLLERAWTKQEIYGPGLVQAHILALKWAFKLGLTSLIDPSTGETSTVKEITTPEAWDDLLLNCDLQFDSPLPKDKLINTQVQTTLVQANLQSQRRAIVELGVKDPDVLLLEIEADMAKKVKAATDALVAAQAVQTPQALSNTSGNPTLDEGGSGVNSGLGGSQGTNTTDSGAQKGRPRSSKP